MDNIKNDSYYIEKTIENIDAIIKYTNSTTYDEFVDNEIMIDAVMFRLVQMVENIKNISNEYKHIHSNILWGQIIGFRNGIVHDYGKTDYKIVYEIINSDIYELRDVLIKK